MKKTLATLVAAGALAACGSTAQTHSAQSQPKATPMPTIYGDWGRKVFHHRIFATAHIPTIDLHEEGFTALTRL